MSIRQHYQNRKNTHADELGVVDEGRPEVDEELVVAGRVVVEELVELADEEPDEELELEPEPVEVGRAVEPTQAVLPKRN